MFLLLLLVITSGVWASTFEHDDFTIRNPYWDIPPSIKTYPKITVTTESHVQFAAGFSHWEKIKHWYPTEPSTEVADYQPLYTSNWIITGDEAKRWSGFFANVVDEVRAEKLASFEDLACKIVCFLETVDDEKLKIEFGKEMDSARYVLNGGEEVI